APSFAGASAGRDEPVDDLAAEGAPTRACRWKLPALRSSGALRTAWRDAAGATGELRGYRRVLPPVCADVRSPREPRRPRRAAPSAGRLRGDPGRPVSRGRCRAADVRAPPR